MKRIATVFIILLCALCSVAADSSSLRTLGSESKVITAYKRKMTGEIPDPEVQIRLLDSNDFEFFANADVDVPLNARNVNYAAFSWVLGGNIYGPVTVTFAFAPMYHEGVTTTTATKIIPYDVTLSHTQTRIGNMPITVNKPSGAASFLQSSFSSYKFKYSDTVSGMGTKSITNASQTFTLVYNMNTENTVVQTAGGETATYPYNVCDYWNRYGSAVVLLKITPEGNRVGTTTKFTDGVYYATVTVTISSN